jgi:hypothetical protein
VDFLDSLSGEEGGVDEVVSLLVVLLSFMNQFVNKRTHFFGFGQCGRDSFVFHKVSDEVSGRKIRGSRGKYLSMALTCL